MNFKAGLNILMLVIAILSFAGFFSYRTPQFDDEDMIVNINDQFQNHFITEKDVRDLIKRTCKVTRDSLEEPNLRSIEIALLQHKFVRKAQVTRNHNAKIIVNIEQDRPIARLISPYGRNGYISARYTVLPLSKVFTARVIVFTGAGTDSLFSEKFLASPQSKFIRQFINYVNSNEFWRTQIAHIDIDQRMNMVFYPLVGSERIEFGSAQNFYVKLKKIEKYYFEILPKVGWNEYSVVNVKFKDQIICR
jgi:cell division protein FtsQ